MLYFDEATHTYKIDDDALKSVSQLVSSQFRPFNANIIATNVAKSKTSDPESRYYGMTKDDIIQVWAESGRDAREKGTNLHRHIETFYIQGKSPEIITPEWSHFLQFIADHPDWTIVGCEVRVHNKKVAGTIDAIFNTPDGLVLVDWKRCKAIDYSGHGTGVDLMAWADDCNYNKYSLQLSLYRQLISYHIVAAYIIQLHPDLDRYQKIRAQNFHIEAGQLLG